LVIHCIHTLSFEVGSIFNPWTDIIGLTSGSKYEPKTPQERPEQAKWENLTNVTSWTNKPIMGYRL